MYQYQKNGRRFTFYIKELGNFLPVGELEVFTEAGKIVDFISDDLAGNIYDAICNVIGHHQTLAEFEVTLQQAHITPR